MITADLYLNKIDFIKYLPGTDCKECGELLCADFVKQLKIGGRTPAQCPSLGENQIRAFELVLQVKRILPEIPALDLPRPVPGGLLGINQADEDSLVLVSGNSEFTQEVLTAIMAFTLSPFWLLLADCRGDTVDMAMVYQSLEVEKILATLEESPLQQRQARREMVLPGFAAKLRQPLEQRTGWQVRVGPVCIAELPLFLGKDWEVPADIDLG
jgi:CO dehydrogenase/acetyl-CoA synthase gamma subunit (corrinoid Fe-S protein)